MLKVQWVSEIIPAQKVEKVYEIYWAMQILFQKKKLKSQCFPKQTGALDDCFSLSLQFCHFAMYISPAFSLSILQCTNTSIYISLRRDLSNISQISSGFILNPKFNYKLSWHVLCLSWACQLNGKPAMIIIIQKWPNKHES